MNEKEIKIEFYRLEVDSVMITSDDYDYILEIIKEDMKQLADHPYDKFEYKISIVEMTQEEYDNLPEGI